MLKRFLIMLALVVVFVLGVGYYKYRDISGKMAAFKQMKMPPVAVTSLVVKPTTWQPVLSCVGSLKAVNGVQVSTDLAGVVSQIAFESGASVKKGDLLLKLDTRQEDAQLASALAKRELSRRTLQREEALLATKTAAQAEYDSAASQARQDDAAVEDARALIARKTIAAPFDGILGIREVNVGQYLNVGSPIVPLQSLDPIYVEFSVPQQDLDKAAVGKKVRLKASGAGDAEFAGEVTAIDSRLDDSTRNIQVEATVPNRDKKLRPGMYVSVDILLPEQSGVLAIPTSSINYAPYGNSVFIIKEVKADDGTLEKRVVQQFVKLGPARGDLVSIVSGLQEGDEVVTSGVFKLHGDATVIVNNSVQPGNDLNPKPPET